MFHLFPPFKINLKLSERDDHLVQRNRAEDAGDERRVERMTDLSQSLEHTNTSMLRTGRVIIADVLN